MLITTNTGKEVAMWTRVPIWEPAGTRFRPYSVTTLIFFYIGKFFRRLFGGTPVDKRSKEK
jgi:hypothetical protein